MDISFFFFFLSKKVTNTFLAFIAWSDEEPWQKGLISACVQLRHSSVTSFDATTWSWVGRGQLSDSPSSGKTELLIGNEKFSRLNQPQRGPLSELTLAWITNLATVLHVEISSKACDRSQSDCLRSNRDVTHGNLPSVTSPCVVLKAIRLCESASP